MENKEQNENQELTIKLLQEQLKRKELENTKLLKQLENDKDKIRELEKITKGIQEGKKQNEQEFFRGKFFHKRDKKLTWDLIIEICKLIMDGQTVNEAINTLGFASHNYYSWLERAKLAKSENDIYFQLIECVKRAKTYAEKRYKNEIDKFLFTPDKEIIPDSLYNELPTEDKIKVKLEHRKTQAVKAKLAMDMLRLTKPNKYYNKSTEIAVEEQITVLQEKTKTSNMESIETFKVVSQLQSIIKKKSESIDLIDENLDFEDD